MGITINYSKKRLTRPVRIKTTVQILCIGTDRCQQTVQTKIRLLLKKQSDQGLRRLPFHQHLLDAFVQCYIIFRTIMAIVRGVPNFRIFTVAHLTMPCPSHNTEVKL